MDDAWLGVLPFLAMAAAGFALDPLEDWLRDRKRRKYRRKVEINIDSLDADVRAIMHKRTGGTCQRNGHGFTMEEVKKEVEAELEETKRLLYFYDTRIALENLQQELSIRRR